MKYKIKYVLKSKKTQLRLKLINMFENESIKNLPSKKKKIIYAKKCLFHPISLVKTIIKKELNIKYIEIVLTTKCILNCKGCSALINIHKKAYDVDLKQNIQSLEKILELSNSIRQLRLLGGEPLLYPNLYEILDYISKQNKIRRATIGTLLIKDSNVINILKNSKFDVFISNYGKISRKKDELIKQLEENNIKYEIKNEDYLWDDYGDLECRNRNKFALKKQFLDCKVTCTSLYEEKLHHCPRSSHGTKLNKIPLKQEDYIDLLNENIRKDELKKKIYNFFYKYTPYVEACNYCDSGIKA